MNKPGTWLEKWNENYERMKPGLERAGGIWKKIWNAIYLIGLWIYRLRSVFLAIPVAYWALKLARINYEMLPDLVGLNLQNDGTYSYMVAKEAAVYGPLAVTAVCLLMVVLSRKTLYPWLISIFTLVLPLLILVTNVFPA